MAPQNKKVTDENNNKERRRHGETDPEVLARRQKQIDYGKLTVGYRNYVRAIPKFKRTDKQIRTPDKFQKCSRRGWDGQIKVWRLLLHAYDKEPSGGGGSEETSEASVSTSTSMMSMDMDDDDNYNFSSSTSSPQQNSSAAHSFDEK